MEINILIVDDEPAARRRLRSLIETDPEVKVVGECGMASAPQR
jgi:two-component system, LytTR family, response regulator